MSACSGYHWVQATPHNEFLSEVIHLHCGNRLRLMARLLQVPGDTNTCFLNAESLPSTVAHASQNHKAITSNKCILSHPVLE